MRCLNRFNRFRQKKVKELLPASERGCSDFGLTVNNALLMIHDL